MANARLDTMSREVRFSQSLCCIIAARFLRKCFFSFSLPHRVNVIFFHSSCLSVILPLSTACLWGRLSSLQFSFCLRFFGTKISPLSLNSAASETTSFVIRSSFPSVFRVSTSCPCLSLSLPPPSLSRTLSFLFPSVSQSRWNPSVLCHPSASSSMPFACSPTNASPFCAASTRPNSTLSRPRPLRPLALSRPSSFPLSLFPSPRPFLRWPPFLFSPTLSLSLCRSNKPSLFPNPSADFLFLAFRFRLSWPPLLLYSLIDSFIHGFTPSFPRPK